MNDRLSNSAKQLIDSPDWHKEVAILREAVIAKGKRAREDVKKTEMWAELAGLDKAIMFINQLADWKR